jgi:hypothetical protein
MAALRGYYRDSYQSSYRALNRQYWTAHLILLSVFAYILFEERFTIGVNTGGRGALQPMDPLIPLVGALVFFGVGRIPGAQLLRLEPRLLIWAPYVALTTALPILAVMVNAEPVRTMYTAIHGFIYLSFLIFGACEPPSPSLPSYASPATTPGSPLSSNASSRSSITSTRPASITPRSASSSCSGTCKAKARVRALLLDSDGRPSE